MDTVSTNSSKLWQLIGLLPQRPREFCNRVSAIVDSRVESYRHRPPRYETVPFDNLIQHLRTRLTADVDSILGEDPLEQIKEEVSRGIRSLPSDAPFALHHNGDFSLAQLCYLLVRLMRPKAVVETGVCYGVTSAFLLQALRVNGTGCLHSLDLPPLGKAGDDFVGWLIPQDLRSNWRLHRGRSVDLLPDLVRQLGEIDIFLHDSLHTYRNMIREFEIVTPFLSAQSVVVADDVEGNAAFKEWVAQSHPWYSAVLQEQSKQSLLGVAMLGVQPPRQPQ